MGAQKSSPSGDHGPTEPCAHRTPLTAALCRHSVLAGAVPKTQLHQTVYSSTAAVAIACSPNGWLSRGWPQAQRRWSPRARSRAVYLPAEQWCDSWPGEVITGARWTSAGAPMQQIPLYVAFRGMTGG
ncbi:MAG TPA: hypothetical protein VF734_06565 [Pseudonocardiaceae bacterium]